MVYETSSFSLGFLIAWFYSKQDQKLPGPPAYIFMIDVSYQSMQCGMVRMLMRELKELLDVLPKWAWSWSSFLKIFILKVNPYVHLGLGKKTWIPACPLGKQPS